MNSQSELFLMDEITHFERETEQKIDKPGKTLLMSSQIDMGINQNGNKKELLNKSGKTAKAVSIVVPSTSKMGFFHKTKDFQRKSRNDNVYDNAKAETGYSSDSSDSDIKFSKRSNTRQNARENDRTGGNRSDSCTSSEFSNNEHSYENCKKDENNYKHFSVSDENMLNIPAFNTVQSSRADGIFALIVFITNVAEFATDFTLVFWHFANGFKWASGLTATFMITGAIGLLQQFSLLQREHLERLFTHSRRIRILVNCFPPLATIVTAYQSSNIAFRSLNNPMYINQFFEIEEFSKSLSKVQSFFQAAPLATLQLVVFIDNIHEISLSKAVFTVANILISLIVMTNANLPAKSDYTDMESIHRAAYIPKSRLFVGLRMLSSFASRAMAITFLLLGFRCLLHEGSALNAVVVSLFVLTLPRLLFTVIDYAHQLVTWRRLNQSLDQVSSGETATSSITNRRADLRTRSEISWFETMIGYSATVFFPVGDPLWVFWFVWCETALFVLFGNITGWTKSCLDTLVNAIYTALFIIVFIVVPILIPYARATVKRHRMKRLDKLFDWRNNVESADNHNANQDTCPSENISHERKNENRENTTE